MQIIPVTYVEDWWIYLNLYTTHAVKLHLLELARIEYTKFCWATEVPVGDVGLLLEI